MLGNILSALSTMTLFWLVALIIFAVAEAATVGLVSIWFAVGAIAALIAAALGAPMWLQLALFLVVSALMLAFLRPLVRKLSKPHKVRLNADRHIGQTALVTEEINNLEERGAIRLDGVIWTARSEDGEVIPVGTTISVHRLTGAKAWVVPVQEPANTSV